MYLYVTEPSSGAVNLYCLPPELETIAKENGWISKIPASLAKELSYENEDKPHLDRTYILSTQAELLRLGFDQSLFKIQFKNEKNICIGMDAAFTDQILIPSQILETYLMENFKEILSDSKKDLSLFDLKEKGKYDFFGQTVYIYMPPAEKLKKFSKLIGMDLSIDEKTASQAYDSLKTYICEGCKKLNEHKIYFDICNGENYIDMYVYLLPIMPVSENAGYSYVNFNQYSLSFSNGRSIFHELTECIGNRMYSPKFGSILGIATNKILVGNFATDDSCGTNHKFICEKDEKNFSLVCDFASSLPTSELDGFIASILDETKESGYTSFRNIDVFDIWHKNKLRHLSGAANPGKLQAM